MKFVATKTAEQLDLRALHWVRERLVSQRTSTGHPKTDREPSFGERWGVTTSSKFFDPVSASNFDPFERRVLAVAPASAAHF